MKYNIIPIYMTNVFEMQELFLSITYFYSRVLFYINQFISAIKHEKDTRIH